MFVCALEYLKSYRVEAMRHYILVNFAMTFNHEVGNSMHCEVFELACFTKSHKW